MQERHRLGEEEITRELFRPLVTTTPMMWVGFIGLGAVLAIFVFAVSWMFYWGLGVTGLQRPNMWGFMIVNFVFWIGISHAGVMISAILRLTQAEWRRPVTRAAEVMTIFSLMTAMLHPVIHTGRPWRTLYWVFPYDFWRNLWPDVRGPLVWDPSAILTYLTGSTLFLYTTMIPDMALARDRTTGWRRVLYTILALGWRGNERQWKMQTIAGFLLSGLILPVFVSVHSIVSWDFAVSLVPTWHATVFAPYFVIGAIHSGVSAVVTLMALMRWLFRFDNYIRLEHFDAIGRLLIAVGTGWLWFFLLDIFFAIYPQEARELEIMQFRLPVAFQRADSADLHLRLLHSSSDLDLPALPPQREDHVLDVYPGQRGYVGRALLAHQAGSHAQVRVDLRLELVPSLDCRGEHRTRLLRTRRVPVARLLQDLPADLRVGREGGAALRPAAPGR